MTRKGATPAALGQLGLIPGSMGAPRHVTNVVVELDLAAQASCGGGRPGRSCTALSRQQMKKREAGEDAVPVLLFIAIPIFSFSCEVRKLKYKLS